MDVPEKERFYFLFRADTQEAEDYKFAPVELRLGLGASNSHEYQDVFVEPGVLELDLARVGSDEMYNATGFYTTRRVAEEKRQQKIEKASRSGPAGDGIMSLVKQLGAPQANQLMDSNAGLTLRVWWVDRETLIEAVEQAAVVVDYMLLDDETLTREQLLERLQA